MNLQNELSCLNILMTLLKIVIKTLIIYVLFGCNAKILHNNKYKCLSSLLATIYVYIFLVL